MTQPPYYPPLGAPSPEGDQAPPAVGYARIYAGAFTLMYVLCVLGGIVIFAAAASGSMGHRVAESYIRAGAMVLVGIPLSIVSAIAFFGVGKRTRGMWTLNLILHAVGCMSCCCLPVAVAMLIQWIKPEVKAWYGA